MTVADLVADALARAGARHLFVASPDGGGHPLLDAALRGGMGAVHAGGARAACVMAAVAGSLADAPGAAAVGLGRDEDGLRDALAQAMRDRSPAIVVGDAALADEDEGIVKASVVVDAATAGHWSAHAVHLALREPRGPVYLVLARAAARAPALPVLTSVRPDFQGSPEPEALDRAAQALAGAVRPVLVAGLGCRVGGVAAWLRALAEALPAPVLVTAKGKGALPDPHPLHLGLVDREGPPHPVLARADLVATIGVDASEAAASAWPEGVPVLRLAASPWAVPGSGPRWEVVGDVALAIEELAPRLRGQQRADWDVAEIARLKATAAAPAGLGPARGGVRSAVVAAVREATAPGTIAVLGTGGDEADLVAAWSTVAPGELVAAAPPGMPGFALPATVAAALARPAARVVCFASARQVAEGARELHTVVGLGLSPFVVVVSDGGGVAAGPPIAALLGDAGWSAPSGDVRRALERWLVEARPTLVDGRGAGGAPTV